MVFWVYLYLDFMIWITKRKNTRTGQSLIKFTRKLGNHFYNKELGTDKDYCIYIDTDSVFYSVPLVKKRYPNVELSDVMMTQRINEIGTEVQGFLNNSYNYFQEIHKLRQT